MKIGELFVQLGVKADTFTVRDFTKAIGDIPFSVGSALVSLAGLSIGFVELTKDVMEMTTGLKVFTAETGLNDRALQQWQMTAKQFGLSGDVATGFITRIAQLMGGLRTGHGDFGALTALGQLGVKDMMGGSVYDVANRIQSAFLNKPRLEAMDLLTRAGMGQAARLFEMPIEQRQAINPMMGKGDEEQMARFTKELAEFNQTVLSEFIKALAGVEPYMSDLTQALRLFIQTFGESARFWLGKLHGSNILGEAFKAASLDDTTVARTLTYYGGDITYNVHGLTDAEATARRLNELRQQHELENMKALKAFNNG